jgi:hypothetical protein
LAIWRVWSQRSGDQRRAIAELASVWAASLLYFIVRGMVIDEPTVANANSHTIIGLEKRLGLFHEASLQGMVVSHDSLVRLANMVYVWWHWPLIVAVMVWLYLKHPADYPLYRNAMLISGCLGLICFALFPAAPPRFLPDFGFQDTVQHRAIFSNILLPPGLTNTYAAMPSLHAGWNLIIGIALFRHATSRPVRLFGIFMPIAMYWAIIVTGNHFILDGLVGDTFAEIGLIGATILAARAIGAAPSHGVSFVPSLGEGSRSRD